MKHLAIGLILLAALGASAVSAADAGGDKLINAGREGQVFDYLPQIVHGKINIVDFYSQYCPPCRQVMPRLEKLTTLDHDIVVLRVDINRPGIQGIDWQSPVAGEYHLRSIPAFKVYDADGKLMAEGQEAAQKVYGMLAQKGI